jgi:hypothetical protein
MNLPSQQSQTIQWCRNSVLILTLAFCEFTAGRLTCLLLVAGMMAIFAVKDGNLRCIRTVLKINRTDFTCLSLAPISFTCHNPAHFGGIEKCRKPLPSFLATHQIIGPEQIRGNIVIFLFLYLFSCISSSLSSHLIMSNSEDSPWGL